MSLAIKIPGRQTKKSAEKRGTTPGAGFCEPNMQIIDLRMDNGKPGAAPF